MISVVLRFNVISTQLIKRTVDFLGAFLCLFFLMLPTAVIGLLIKLTSTGPIFFWSARVGRLNKIFQMPKFRTMRTETPSVASHLLENPAQYLTPIGGFLRKTSLDELPQLWSIFKGDMSFVGPRPALFNQEDLISLRTQAGVDKLIPGLTGWAQINGRDELSISEKVKLDTEYLKRQSLSFDFYILAMTIKKALSGDGVTH